MQFTSPAFVFLFLPIAFVIYCIIPRQMKKAAITVFCVGYYLLANFFNPFAPILLAAVILFVLFYSRFIDSLRGRMRLYALLPAEVLLVGALIALRLMDRYGYNLLDVDYPFGAAIFFLSAISCLVDVKRGDAPPPRFFDCILYMTYFPVMVAGPIIKYKDSDGVFGNIEFSVDNIALGAQYFMIGFIKRIAVAALLYEAYETIISNSDGVFSFTIALILVAMITVMTYAMFSGYSDMGVGISLIFGIRLSRNFANPFVACTPCEYLKRFMMTLYDFAHDYVKRPIEGDGKNPARRTAGYALLCCFFVLWFRTDIKMLITALPMIGIACAVYITGFGKYVNRNFLTRTAGRAATILLLSLFWTTIRLENPFAILGHIKNIFLPSSGHSDLAVLRGISFAECLLVAFAALLAVLPATHFGSSYQSKHKGRVSGLLSNVFFAMVFAMFAFSIIYFLPQFPQYATSAIDVIFK